MGWIVKQRGLRPALKTQTVHPAVASRTRRPQRCEAIMPTIEALCQRQRELEAEIAEARLRLPAHSIKPPVMKLLLDLEDEYDEVRKAIEALKRAGASSSP